MLKKKEGKTKLKKKEKECKDNAKKRKKEESREEMRSMRRDMMGWAKKKGNLRRRAIGRTDTI